MPLCAGSCYSLLTFASAAFSDYEFDIENDLVWAGTAVFAMARSVWWSVTFVPVVATALVRTSPTCRSTPSETRLRE